MKTSVNLFNKLVLLLGAVFLCGSPTFSYDGKITTSEKFQFSTYQKVLPEANAFVSAGVGKTKLKNVLAIYFEVENKGSENLYIESNDVEIYTTSGGLITPTNYALQYESDQNKAIMSKQALPTYANDYSNYMTSYGGNVQNHWMREQMSTDGSMKHVNQIATGIRAHSLPTTKEIIKPAEKKYYYMFLQDGQYPITLHYKGLNYTFNGEQQGL